jgi:hypothetical protein
LTADVRAGARPAVIGGPLDQSHPHRGCDPRSARPSAVGRGPAAPNRSGSATNDRCGAAGDGTSGCRGCVPAQRPRQRVRPLGNRNPMDMVGHQAVDQDSQTWRRLCSASKAR